MELKDLLFTPITLLLVYLAAYSLRSRFTDEQTRQYFIPALTVKIIGAISLGLVYQFYYQGGDTFNYFEQSKVLYGALINDPIDGLRLLLANGDFHPGTFEYATQMYWYRSPSEYFIIKMAAVCGLLNGNSYSSIAVLFAVFSFSGLWALYYTFYRIAPKSKLIALCILFVPSVFFWGSGLMKDTVALGALGWLFFGLYRAFILKVDLFRSVTIALLAVYMIYTVKIYILLSFLPPAILWIFLESGKHFRGIMAKWVLRPVLLSFGLLLAYFAAINVTEGDIRYDLDNIGERTKINAEYLYRISVAQGGSAYYLGALDGTIGSMLSVAPQAVVVTLFRPFPWEVSNLFMLLSAVESLLFTAFLLYVVLSNGIIKTIKVIFTKPIISFCFAFTVIFAFAVGLNSYNFGTLVRYKIQLLPFYLSGISLVGYFISLERGTNKEKDRLSGTLSKSTNKEFSVTS